MRWRDDLHDWESSQRHKSAQNGANRSHKRLNARSPRRTRGDAFKRKSDVKITLCDGKPLFLVFHGLILYCHGKYHNTNELKVKRHEKNLFRTGVSF